MSEEIDVSYQELIIVNKKVTELINALRTHKNIAAFPHEDQVKSYFVEMNELITRATAANLLTNDIAYQMKMKIPKIHRDNISALSSVASSLKPKFDT